MHIYYNFQEIKLSWFRCSKWVILLLVVGTSRHSRVSDLIQCMCCSCILWLADGWEMFYECVKVLWAMKNGQRKLKFQFTGTSPNPLLVLCGQIIVRPGATNGFHANCRWELKFMFTVGLAGIFGVNLMVFRVFKWFNHQSSIRVALKQHRSSIRAALEQHWRSIGTALEKHQSSIKAL